MASRQDFLLSNGDLLIQNGDFVIGPSDDQHIYDTINAFPGWWKQNPADGVGLFQYSGSSGKIQEMQRSIKLQLESDGYSTGNPIVKISGGQIFLNPNVTDLQGS